MSCRVLVAHISKEAGSSSRLTTVNQRPLIVLPNARQLLRTSGKRASGIIFGWTEKASGRTGKTDAFAKKKSTANERVA
jgi:hypothetical protein